jgi:hypothetical protein
MSTVHEQIQAHVDAFAAELTALIRQAALESVQSALGVGRVARPATAPRAAAAPAVHAAKAAKAAPKRRAAAPAAPARRGRKKGQKRDPNELAKLGERLFAYLKANPGQRMEVIQVALGVPGKDLSFPLKKLRAANRISSKGKKQATMYFVK